jgi:hypothetical protein
MLTFNKAMHEYRWNGVVVPHWSLIAQSAGITQDYSKVPDEDLKNAIELGRNVHLACELYDKGDLVMDILDPVVKHCLDQWIAVQAEISTILLPEIGAYKVHIEIPMYSQFGYACTPDRIMVFYPLRLMVVIEIKTSDSIRGSDIQTAAQAQCGMEKHPDIRFKKTFRFTAHLRWNKPEGQFFEHKNKSDWNTFLSALNLYKWKEERGYL